MICGQLHLRSFRSECLDDHLAWLPAPTASGQLGQKLKCPLAGSEVREAEADVSDQNSSEGYAGKIETLSRPIVFRASISA